MSKSKEDYFLQNINRDFVRERYYNFINIRNPYSIGNVPQLNHNFIL